VSKVNIFASLRKVGSNGKARTRRKPRKKPPPCMTCGEPRIWAMGQFADAHWEAVCVDCTCYVPAPEGYACYVPEASFDFE
jgi:hypothetical protein